MKYQLDTLDGLDDSVKALYEEKDGKFILKVEGLPTGDNGLADRIKKLEANNQALLDEKRKAKEAADVAAQEAAKKSGDIEALEKSWADKLSSKELELGDKMKRYENLISDLTVGSEATKLAAELFGENAELAMPHVLNRLTYEITDTGAKIRVKGPDGSPTAATIDELKKEITNDPRFSAILVGTRASGSGNHSGKSNGAPTTKKFNEMSGAELSALRREDPSKYDRLKKEYYGT